MPWRPLVGNNVAQMVVENIDDLIVGNGVILTPPYDVPSMEGSIKFQKNKTHQKCPLWQSGTGNLVSDVENQY